MENNLLITVETYSQPLKEIYALDTYEQLTSISLDYSIFNSLKEFLVENDNTDDFILIITTYLQETDQRLNKLEELIKKEDAERLIQIAHGLKGVSATLGVIKFSKLCSGLEQIAYNGLLNEATSMLVEIREEFDVARNLLLENVSKLVKWL